MVSAWIPAVFLLDIAVWFGIVAGVSCLATPVKFRAPSLSRPAALDVGRHTFHLLQRVERVLAWTALFTALAWRPVAPLWSGLPVLAVILAIQAFWLLPTLETRVEAALSGAPTPPSGHHRLYAALEGLKLIVLGATATATASSLIIN